MASDNGWITPVHETRFEAENGVTMVRVVARRKTGQIRVYIQFPDGSRLGLSVDDKHILASRGPQHEPIRKSLDAAEIALKETNEQLALAQ